MSTPRFYAEVTFRHEKPGEAHQRLRVAAKVPSDVRDFFAAGAGDRLVFEEGNSGAAERAALRGKYLIVRLERAPEPALEPAAAPRGESLQELVRRKLDG